MNYHINPNPDCDESYEELIGPNGFSCLITEPEDRTFYRDLRNVVDELNRLNDKVVELQGYLDYIYESSRAREE